jgi:hypothetical protein
MVAAIDPQGCSHDPSQNWADADVAAAAEGLCRIRNDPQSALAMAERARVRAEELFSLDHYVGLIKDALEAA